MHQKMMAVLDCDIYILNKVFRKFVKCFNPLQITSPIGKMILITLKWAQRIAGTSAGILQQPATKLPQLDDERWIQTLRDFLHRSDLHLKIPAIICPKPKRLNDSILMDHIFLQQIPKHQILVINRCRIFLKVESLADICNASGTEIQHNARQCDYSARTNDISKWPDQPRPGPNHRMIWIRFLKKFCHNKSKRLLQPLGEWTGPHTNIPWDTWIDADRKNIYTTNNQETFWYSDTTQYLDRINGRSRLAAPSDWYNMDMTPVNKTRQTSHDITTSLPPTIFKTLQAKEGEWIPRISEYPEWIAAVIPGDWHSCWNAIVNY
jgi:hypothetical protein